MSNECMSLPPVGDLIDRIALLNEFRSGFIDRNYVGFKEMKVLDMIKDAPIVDAVPVVHAKWVVHDHYPPECSNCGGIAPKDCEGENFYLSDYCQSCGAKMDGESNE